MLHWIKTVEKDRDLPSLVCLEKELSIYAECYDSTGKYIVFALRRHSTATLAEFYSKQEAIDYIGGLARLLEAVEYYPNSKNFY